MESAWWLMALIGLVVLFGLIVLALITVGLVDPGVQGEVVADTKEPSIEVPPDPRRITAGVGVAVVLVAVAGWVIKRTDWSIEE